MDPCIVRIFQYISNKMQRYTVYYIWKLLYMFRVVPQPIIRSACNCIYRCSIYSCMRSWWWVEVPPETCRAVSRYNKLCNVASCWIYIGILNTILCKFLLQLFRYCKSLVYQRPYLVVSPEIISNLSMCKTPAHVSEIQWKVYSSVSHLM